MTESAQKDLVKSAIQHGMWDVLETVLAEPVDGSMSAEERAYARWIAATGKMHAEALKAGERLGLVGPVDPYRDPR
jgi:hypothetical protein